jgi:hypothetical protein
MQCLKLLVLYSRGVFGFQCRSIDLGITLVSKWGFKKTMYYKINDYAKGCKKPRPSTLDLLTNSWNWSSIYVPICVVFFLFFFGLVLFCFVLCVFSTPQSLIMLGKLLKNLLNWWLKDAFLRGNKNFPKQIFQYPGVRTQKREWFFILFLISGLQ